MIRGQIWDLGEFCLQVELGGFAVPCLGHYMSVLFFLEEGGVWGGL